MAVPKNECQSKSQTDLLLESMRVFDPEECAICTAQLFPTDEAGDDSPQIVCLPRCRHVFHEECMKNWIASSSSAGPPSCPSCKTNLVAPPPPVVKPAPAPAKPPPPVQRPAVVEEQTFHEVVTTALAGVVDDTCQICRHSISDLCIMCHEVVDREAGLWCGAQFNMHCEHSFHTHCIDSWRRRRDSCPADNLPWQRLMTIHFNDIAPAVWNVD
jgi:hypothetical protein